MPSIIKLFIEYHSEISDFLAVVAFFLSSYQLIQNYLHRRTNIALEIQNLRLTNNEKDEKYKLLLTISNNSDLPIIITKILLIDDLGKEFPCCLTHKYIGEHYYNKYSETDIPCTERIFSVDFPICLPAHGAAMPYIVFAGNSIRLSFRETSKLHIKVVTDKKTKYFCLDIPDIDKNELSI